MKLLFYTFILSISAFSLQIGDPAPSLKALNQYGEEVHLNDLFESNPFVFIYFYPRADTPGCTAQACSLRDAYEVLQKKGVKVVGISNDSVEDQKAFKEKHRLPFDLLSDSDSEIAKAYKVPVRFGFTSRQAFLIEEGKLIWLDRSASTSKQAQDVLDFLKKR